jgi:hypothetical protein
VGGFATASTVVGAATFIPAIFSFRFLLSSAVHDELEQLKLLLKGVQAVLDGLQKP